MPLVSVGRWCSISVLLLVSTVARAQDAVQASPPPYEPRAAPSPSEATAAVPVKTEDDPELDILTFHRSNYFLTGFTDQTQVKFQFSFKFDLWPSTSHHTVYLAYTQKSLWDAYDKSAPFRESNYAPEIFYAHYHADNHSQPSPGCGLFSEQVGIEHESNGESGSASRAWNRVFADARATCYGRTAYGLLGLRAWYPFLVDENRTITKTQGYAELLIGIGADAEDVHMNGLVTAALRKGTSKDLGKGSLTVDARWRPTYQRVFGKAWKFAPYLWFQFFDGYGETLGTYASVSTSVRVGFGFTDRAR
jgi:phospholipase A1